MQIEIYKRNLSLTKKLKYLNEKDLEYFNSIMINFKDEKELNKIINKIESIYKNKLFYKVKQHKSEYYFNLFFIKNLGEINILGFGCIENDGNICFIHRDIIKECNKNIFLSYPTLITIKKLKNGFGKFISDILIGEKT